METIMGLFNQALQQIQLYVSWPYLLAFMLLTYFVKTTFRNVLKKATKTHWKMGYTVLLLGLILAVPFYLYTEEGWMKILVTYAVGTSLHDLLFHKVEALIKSK